MQVVKMKSQYNWSIIVSVPKRELKKKVNDNKIKTIGQPIANKKLKVDINIQNPSDYSFQFDMGIAPDFNLEGINLDNKLAPHSTFQN